MRSYAWELFKPQGPGRPNLSDECIAKVYQSGSLAITRATKDLVNSDYVSLVISVDRRVFGLLATKEDDPNAYRLRYLEGSNRWILNLNDFMRFYELEHLKGQTLNTFRKDNVVVLAFKNKSVTE